MNLGDDCAYFGYSSSDRLNIEKQVENKKNWFKTGYANDMPICGTYYITETKDIADSLLFHYKGYSDPQQDVNNLNDLYLIWESTKFPAVGLFFDNDIYQYISIWSCILSKC
jgi:hypothetical protein